MSTLPGLDKSVPIVDPKSGRITPYMQRFWQNLQLVFADAATSVALMGNQTVAGLKTFISGIQLGATNGPQVLSGAGVPSASAPSGSVYLRTDGGAGSSLYVREGTGWTAK